MTDSPTSEKAFTIREYYVKSLQFKLKTPSAALSQPAAKNHYQQEIRIAVRPASNDHYEVVLELNIIGKAGEQTLFTADLEQAGLFELKGLTEQEKDQVLHMQAAHLLYPYASKVLTQMTTDAHIQPVYLTPIDFVTLYQQRKAATEKDAKTQGVDSVSKTVTGDVISPTSDDIIYDAKDADVTSH